MVKTQALLLQLFLQEAQSLIPLVGWGVVSKRLSLFWHFLKECLLIIHLFLNTMALGKALASKPFYVLFYVFFVDRFL